MPELSKEEVLKVGDLARLEISPKELDSLVEHFNSILHYVSKLNELDLSDVDPFSLDDVPSLRLRDDEPVSCSEETREAILNQSPSRDGDFIRVPRIGGEQ
ncbi:MAG: Asp-tRNA(Asn)/Glu-tRNA(Gln) amidotransferase subunit GatC [Pyramidobacter sp.]